MPAPVNLEFKFTTGPLNQATQTVYIRNAWSDAWTAAPDLHCDSLSFAAAPSIGTASFHYRYGERVKSLESAFATVSRFAPNPRSYVKVVITPSETMSDSITWVGVWRRVTDNGLRQSFQADSIEAMLAFDPIRNAFYYDVFGAVKQSQCAMTFNDNGRPNRSANKQPVRSSQAYVFDADPERAKHWSTRDIVEYLLAAHPPLKVDGSTVFTWTIFDIDRLPNYDRPTLAARNKDVLSLLHSAISRYRLLSFRIEIQEVVGPPAYTAVILRPFTFTDTAIPLTNYVGASVGEIPANDWQFTLDFRKDPSSAASLSIQANHVADRIVVMGGWRQSVCSLSKPDESIEPTWKPIRESEYIDAEGTLDAAGELPAESERYEREQSIRRLRTADRYEEVFAQWRIKKLWDQKAGDGIGGVKNPIALNDDDTQYVIPQHLLEIQSELPFLYGYKYDENTIETLATANIPGHRAGELFGGKWPHQQLPLFVFLKEGSADKWIDLATLGRGADLETEDITAPFDVKKAISRHWSGEARPVRGSTVFLRDAVEPGGLPELIPTGVITQSPAFRIDIHGAQQHALAATEFLFRDDDVKGSFDWKTMIVTVAVDDPRQIVVTYPPDEPDDPVAGATYVSPIGEFINEKVIEVGDEYRQIYVCPGTVVGINELTGELKRSTGGYLQDDRNYLMVIAKRAFEWYKTPRYALMFATGFVSGILKVGHYIASIRDMNNLLDVGSVITEITLDFPVAKGRNIPAPKVTYATAFGELDPSRLF